MTSATGFRMRVPNAELAALALAALTPASADENQTRVDMFDGQWHVSVTPCVPTILASATPNPFAINNGVTTHVTTTPGDYLPHLAFAFFLASEARRGDWSLFADYV